MKRGDQSRAERLASAVSEWVSGEWSESAGAIREVLAGRGLENARALVKGARARFPAEAAWLTSGSEVSDAFSRTPVEDVDWCLLGCMAHRSGYVREAAAAELVGLQTAAAAMAGMLAADDHVAEVRHCGRSAVARLSVALLANRADFVGERWRAQERQMWRDDAMSRLRGAEGENALFREAMRPEGRCAVAALRLFEALHNVDEASASRLTRSASWRVRRLVALRAVDEGWVGVARLVADDSRRMVRRALVEAAAHHEGELREVVMRKQFNDPSAAIRRIASWYLKGDLELVEVVQRDLQALAGKARRLRLVNAVVMAPELARSCAAKMLASELAADRRAAVGALLDTDGGISNSHLVHVLGEHSLSVRREILQGFDRVGGESGRLKEQLCEAWDNLDRRLAVEPC